ncbi:MAG TPA: carbon-nitrogen hydrolase family protein [Amycolatopsis sp.]|uniref:carbon-nitrogen hydrolase family protein n=1 Tax=Amycolatopsis sp. TaxID=37632 RepID=UPI002F3FA1ED
MKIACWEAAPGGISPAGLRAVAARAAAAGAALLVLPELSGTGYLDDPARLRSLAEPPDGPHCREVSAIAAETGIALVHGWAEADGPHVYNSARLVGGDGRELLRYRKSHLYGPIERAAFDPGSDGVVQASFDGVTVGVLICYDVEFPEAVRAHALAGTQLLLVPTALMEPCGFVATGLVPARAFENQLFVAYSNWAAPAFCGLSRVVGPDGRVRTGDGPLRIAEIDLAEIPPARQLSPYLADRRPELFA